MNKRKLDLEENINKKQKISSIIEERNNFIKMKLKYYNMFNDCKKEINETEKWLLENCNHNWEHNISNYSLYNISSYICSICGCEK